MTTPIPIFRNLNTGQNQITLIASGKGGVGKTWYSISYAFALARLGKRVLLFDGDLGMANIDIQLGLMPEKDLGSYISGEFSLEDIIQSYPNGAFDIIAGRSGTGDLANLSDQRFSLLKNDITKIAKNYDHIILDLGAGIGRSVRQLSQLADRCLVIVTDEPTSITDAYAFIKVTRSSIPNLKLELVVNQAQSIEQGRQTYSTLESVCENFLGFIPPLFGIVRSDPHVKDAIRHQTSIMQRHPNSLAAEDVNNIALKNF